MGDRMVDREKVIDGLVWCMNEEHDCYREKGCPYENEGEDVGCKYALHRDALALLKAQEQVVHAHWVEEPDRVNHWHCSNCGCPVGIASIAYRYCYVCGAKMAEHPRAADGCGQAFSPD